MKIAENNVSGDLAGEFLNPERTQTTAESLRTTVVEFKKVSVRLPKPTSATTEMEPYAPRLEQETTALAGEYDENAIP